MTFKELNNIINMAGIGRRIGLSDKTIRGVVLREGKYNFDTHAETIAKELEQAASAIRDGKVLEDAA